MIAEIVNDAYAAFGDYDGEDYALHRQNPTFYAGAADLARAQFEAQEAIGEEAYDTLLRAVTFEALAESDPNLKIDALLRLAGTALSFAAAVEDQAVESEKGQTKGGE